MGGMSERERWEYKVENKLPTGLKGERMLNSMGSDGWELVFVAQDSTGVLKGSVMSYIFKRRAL